MFYKAVLSIVLLQLLALSNLESASADLSATETDKKVSLIHPNIIGAKKDGNDSLIIFTRASRYRLNNFLKNPSQLAINRLDEFNEPKSILSQTSYYGPDGSPITYAQANADTLKQANSERQKKSVYPILSSWDTTWLQQSGSFKINLSNSIVEISIRDDILRVVGPTTVCPNLICYTGSFRSTIIAPSDKLKFGYLAPITNMIFRSEGQGVKAEKEFTAIIFDTTGRAMTVEFVLQPFKNQAGKPLLSIRNVDINYISEVDYPKANAGSQAPKIIPESILEQINRKDELKKKFDYSQIQAISPMYDAAVDVNDDTTQVALCMSHAIQAIDGTQNYNQSLDCLWKGEDQIKYGVQFQANATVEFIINALHIGRHTNQTIYHLIYTREVKSHGPSESFYLKCSFDALLKEGNTLRSTLNIDENNRNCKKKQVFTVPSDLVGFKGIAQGGKLCHRVVAFFDSLYYTYDMDGGIDEGKNATSLPVKNANFPFYIRAAFAIGNKFYFFTHSNTIVVMNGTYIDDGCTEIKFDYVKDMLAHDFVLYHISEKFSASEPNIIDYREYVEGAIDTNPPLKETINTSGSRIGIMVIALILGGLILAGLIYMFCLRGSRSEPNSRRSRRSTGKPPLSADSALHVKTLRSSMHGKDATPKSKMGQDKQGSKISPMSSKSPASGFRLGVSRSQASSPRSPLESRAASGTGKSQIAGVSKASSATPPPSSLKMSSRSPSTKRKSTSRSPSGTKRSTSKRLPMKSISVKKLIK